MDIVLIAGLWLPESIWADVGAELEQLGQVMSPPQRTKESNSTASK